MEHKISYDRKFDVLYVRISTEHSYGDASRDDGIVVMRSIETEAVTGEIVFGFRKQLEAGTLRLDELPVPLEEKEVAGLWNSPSV